MKFGRVILFSQSLAENKDDWMYPLHPSPYQTPGRDRENGIFRWLPEYSEIICRLLIRFVNISSCSFPPTADGGEDELQDDAVGQQSETLYSELFQIS